MKVKDFLAVIEPSDRVLIVNGEEEIYRGYVGLMRYHKFELDKYLDIDVLKIREKTEPKRDAGLLIQRHEDQGIL